MSPPRQSPLARQGLRFALVGLLAVICCLGSSGCRETKEHGPVASAPVPAVPHPKIERDLAAIRADGVLRVLFHYDSSSYFIHRGASAGFDFELVERFAREQGLTISTVLPNPGDDLVTLLNEGAGDVACGNLLENPETLRWVASTRPTNFVQKVLVLPADDERAQGLEALAGLTVNVPEHDPFRVDLHELRESGGYSFLVGASPSNLDAEELIARVGSRKLDSAIVDDLVAQVALTYRDDVRIGMPIGDRRPAVWLMRQNSPDLQTALNQYLRKHLSIGPDGQVRRSHDYAVIHNRYFENPHTIRDYRKPTLRPDKGGVISHYDPLIRARSEALGLDWRVVAALIFQESRFQPEAISGAGASGLMQILPRFAGEQADSLMEPGPNLTAGLRMLRTIYDGYAYLDSLEQWRFSLAEYHAGPGHLADARRIAIDMKRDPNLWKDSVEAALPKLMETYWFERAQQGYFRGVRTVRYVNQIMNRANLYAQVVPRLVADDADSSSAVAIK